ncbi:MAG: hypothetical protein J5778_04460 [Clostridiales bacterium]|nr:hypothetical protein [Clostridiales bacterium]
MGKKEVNYYTSSSKWKNELIDQVNPIDVKYSRDRLPDAEELDYYVKCFDDDESLSESALKCVFTNKPSNIEDNEYIYIKVSLLNDIYSTHLSNNDKKTIVNIIMGFQSSIESKVYDPNLVFEICQVCKGNNIGETYSFVSKYCSHHNEDLYPIYDRYVVTMLLWYRELAKEESNVVFDFKDECVAKNSGKYNCYRNVLNQFRQQFGLESYTYKEIDKFLWKAGKNYFPAYIDEKIVNRYKHSIQTNLEINDY